MTAQAKLTETQTAILKAAARRPDGTIEPLPPTLRGGARVKVIEGLLARELIAKFHYPDRVEYYATDAGFAAVGRRRKLPAPVVPDPELEAAVTAAETKWQADAVTKRDAADGVQNLDPIPRPIRPGTKLAEIIEAMKRPGGATVAEMMRRTGWQAHTVRGAISGMVRKRFDYQVVTEKGADGQRAYRIT
ncbi:MAG: DUF3489 domain-containing protein [Sulfuritalea sp.]|nr:DUF3489 domain-containing protein [Sulfuritalea sp.]